MRRRSKTSIKITTNRALRTLEELLRIMEEDAAQNAEVMDSYRQYLKAWEAEHAASHTKWGGLNVN